MEEGAAAVSIERVDSRRPHIAMDLALGVSDDPSHGVQGAPAVELENSPSDEEEACSDEEGDSEVVKTAGADETGAMIRMGPVSDINIRRRYRQAKWKCIVRSKRVT